MKKRLGALTAEMIDKALPLVELHADGLRHIPLGGDARFPNMEWWEDTFHPLPIQGDAIGGTHNE